MSHLGDLDGLGDLGDLGDEGAPTGATDDDLVDLLADLAWLLLSASAEGTRQISGEVSTVARAYGTEVKLLVMPDQLMLVVDGTSRVVVASPGISLHRLEAAHELVRDIAAGLPRPEARRRLDQAMVVPLPYPWWLRIVGVVLFAIGFAPSVVPSVSEVGVSVVLGLIMGVLVVAATERTVESLLPLLGSFAVGCVALTVFEDQAAKVGPVLLMIPALFVVIPGDYLSVAAAELAVGRVSAGATRLLWAVVILLQLVVGIVAATQVTGTGADQLFDGTAPGNLPYWVVVVAWVPFTLGLALTFGARLGNVPIMAVLTMGTYVIYSAVASLVGDLTGTLAAGAALGAVATVLAKRVGSPPWLELILGGFFALTVGALGLRGVSAVIGGQEIAGVEELGDFLLLFPAVAFGILAGELVAGGLPSVATWFRGRSSRGRAGPAARRRRGGPLRA